MAKGTNIKGVNFSVSEGADPLGIGIPDLGKSSFDPIASIRQGWETSRQDRMIKDAERKEEYQNYIKDLPTFDEINNKFAQDLNKDVQDMSALAYKKYKAGSFDPFVRGKSGQPAGQELMQKKKEIQQKQGLYQRYLPMFEKAVTEASDIKNKDLIDQELTKQNFDKIRSAETMEEWAQSIQQNPVVYKPTPVDLVKEVDARLKTLLPDDETLGITRTLDPNTGMYRITTKEGVSNTRAVNSMRKVYRDLIRNDRYKNYISSAYQNEDALRKQTQDGLPLDQEDWFISQYIPEYGQKITEKYVSPKSDSEKGKDKKVEIQPDMEDDGMWYRTLDEAITIPDRITVYNPDGTTSEKPVSSAKLSGFGYTELPDGSKGKAVRFIVTEKGIGENASPISKEYLAPYENYKNRIKQIYNPVDVQKMESIEDVVAPVTYTAEGSVDTKQTGSLWWKGKEDEYNVQLKDRQGNPVSPEENVQFKSFMQSEGIKDVNVASKLYSNIRTYMRDNYILYFEEGVKKYKESIQGNPEAEKPYNKDQDTFLNSIKKSK